MIVRKSITSLKNAIRGMISHSFLGKHICWSVPGTGNKIALTFDDGPSENTLDVLKILDEGRAKATFFVLSNSIDKFPKIFEEVIQRGHQVAIHGSDHRRGDLKNQILECDIGLRNLGHHTKLVRPPYGQISITEFFWCVRRGFKVILWSFDSQDSMRLEGKVSTDPNYEDVGAGDIILMHDDNVKCVDELPLLLKLIKENNFEAVTLDEML